MSEAAKALEEASERHPEDLQITYLQARLHCAKKETGEAETLLNGLVAAYPKIRFIWPLYQMYNTGKTRKNLLCNRL